MHGIVTAFDSIPIISATVHVRSKREVVLTDSIERYTVMCNPEDRLIINARGFKRERVNLNEKTRYAFVNLQLIPGERNLEAAVGYGNSYISAIWHKYRTRILS